MTDWSDEVSRGDRFAFGSNWRRYLRLLDDSRIEAAAESLRATLDADSLDNRRFLDIGSGSGLFSLAARRLGARVHSLDYDPESVACTRELRARYFPDDPDWVIERASVLDRDHLARLEPADIVYSWGVLHHTGALWRALGNACSPVAAGGLLVVALYNDQGWISRYWHGVKRLYNIGPATRWAMIALHAPYLLLGRLVWRAISGRLRLERGMDLWHDMKDWLGGLPFEVASPAAVETFCAERGFRLVRLRGCGRRHGCNEFVFERLSEGARPVADR